MTEQNFILRMREARKARGLSQEELGRKIGRNQSKISRIEAGTQPVRLDDAIAIANRLQVPLLRMCSPQPLEFVVNDDLAQPNRLLRDLPGWVTTGEPRRPIRPLDATGITLNEPRGKTDTR